MTREGFVELPGNVQWAIVSHWVFHNELLWSYDNEGNYYWVDSDGVEYPNDIDIHYLAYMIRSGSEPFYVHTDVTDTGRGWFVRRANDNVTFSDVNLPWAILKAFSVNTDGILEPVMLEEDLL